MSSNRYRERLEKIVNASADELTLGQQYIRTRTLCRELIAEIERLEDRLSGPRYLRKPPKNEEPEEGSEEWYKKYKDKLGAVQYCDRGHQI